MLSFSIAGLYKLYMMHPMKLNISNVIKFHLFNLSLTWWYFDFCAKLDLVLHCWLGKVVIFISVPVGNTGSYCWSFALYLCFRSIFCFSSIWILQYMPRTWLTWNEALVQSKSSSAVQFYSKPLLVCPSLTNAWSS